VNIPHSDHEPSLPPNSPPYYYAFVPQSVGASAVTVNMTASTPSGAGTALPKRTPYRAARAFCLVTVLVAVIALYTSLSPRHAINLEEYGAIERRGLNISLAEDLEVRIVLPSPTTD
jgi:hypothetical protein